MIVITREKVVAVGFLGVFTRDHGDVTVLTRPRRHGLRRILRLCLANITAFGPWRRIWWCSKFRAKFSAFPPYEVEKFSWSGRVFTKITREIMREKGVCVA